MNSFSLASRNQAPRSSTPERPPFEPLPHLVSQIAELLSRQPTAPQLPRPSKRSRNGVEKPAAKASSRHARGKSNGALPQSPLESLAAVAEWEARSPQLSQSLYNYSPNANTSSTAPWLDVGSERPSKRARSEAIPSPMMTSPHFEHTAHRPTTSYNGWSYNLEHGIDSRQRLGTEGHIRSGSVSSAQNGPEPGMDEAELLLNFSRGGGSSGSRGLGIFTSTTRSSGSQRLPALPPFPFATTAAPLPDGRAPPEEHGKGQTSSQHERANQSKSQTNGVHPEGMRDLARLSPPGQPESGADSVSDPKSTTLTSGEGEPNGTVKSPEESLRETPVALNLTESRRTSSAEPTDSLQNPDMKDNGSKDVTEVESAEAAPELEVLYDGEATERKAETEESQGEPSSRKLHEQGVVCPGCKFAADSMSEKLDWLQCDGCDQWYHVACTSIPAKQSERIDKFFCKACTPKFGKSTWKRKSTRIRTTVDYAGLNEGVLRAPEQTREHHYIDSFKNGTLNLTPETFPRIPGSEITADFFQKCSAFNEPVLVPASLNPRPAFPGTTVRESMAADDDRELVPDDGQDHMDMVIPQELTVRRVSNLYGPKNQIPVIEVKEQESSKGWTVEKWADYYENAADQPIRNVISLECSTTPLCRLIRRPKVVRELDLQDSVWPDTEWRKSVGFYVLMSVADSFTDFHIDFGGSSVYYHILKGRKVFFFIPPTPSNLQKYQDWNNMPSQNWTWLPDQTKGQECYRVDLYPGDTMLIPAGWIHAVWTPDDSLVIGGNFLTRLHYGMQFRVAEIEKNNKTPLAFRYPKFQKVMWYAVLQYLEHDPLPESVREDFLDGKQFPRTAPMWSEFDLFGENSRPGRENFNARYYSKAELDGLPELVNYIFRTVMIYLDRLETISAQTRKAVSESIPKGKGDPLDLAQNFAMWVAWKRGNEDIPEWAHPGAILPHKPEEPADKKLSDAQLKKLQKPSAISIPERQSARLKSVAECAMQQEQLALATPKTSTLGPRRTACDSCRKRKMRCKHVESGSSSSTNGPAIVFTNPIEALPFPGYASPHAQLAAYQPQQGFAVDHQAPSMTFDSGLADLSDFAPGPKQEVTELKKGRTKACYDCRRSKRRCIHDEFGRVDPVKQKEPVVPRGAAKRKSGSGPEMPLAKKPVHDQAAPVAPMVPGHIIDFDSKPVVAQDGMFRNSTINDFSGLVNVNPLAGQGASRPQMHGEANMNGAPPPQPPMGWALDPALMDEEMISSSYNREPPAENDGYTDAEDALMAYYQSTHPQAPALPDQSENPMTLLNGSRQDSEGEDDMAIDPSLELSIVPTSADSGGAAMSNHDADAMDIDPALQEMASAVTAAAAALVITNGVKHPEAATHQPGAKVHQRDSEPGRPNDILPSTENLAHKRQSSREIKPIERFTPETTAASPKQRRMSSQVPQTPVRNGVAKSTSPEAARWKGTGKTPAKRPELVEQPASPSVIQEVDEETKKLIEQLRQEDLTEPADLVWLYHSALPASRHTDGIAGRTSQPITAVTRKRKASNDVVQQPSSAASNAKADSEAESKRAKGADTAPKPKRTSRTAEADMATQRQQGTKSDLANAKKTPAAISPPATEVISTMDSDDDFASQELESSDDDEPMLDADSDVSDQDTDDYEDDIGFEPQPKASKDVRKVYEVAFSVYSPQDIQNFQDQEINQTQELVGQPPQQTAILLRRFKWNREKLLEAYMDDQAAVLDSVGLEEGETGKAKIEDAPEGFMCEICCDDEVDLKTFAMKCSHRFCVDCYRTYLYSKIKEEGEAARIKCPGDGCNRIVDSRSLDLLVNEDLKERYQELLTRTYVDDLENLKWCPAPNCVYAIDCKVKARELKRIVPTVHCDCGHNFCFGCTLNEHQPAPCGLVRKWLKKCEDDSETANWISANTKECPKCHSTIEKNGGCNHMTCRKCRNEFCWMCMGTWAEHGTSWYNCNRFEERSGLDARDAQAKSRQSLERYLHYYNRYANHEQSAKLDKDIYIKTEKKMTQLQSTANMSWIDVQFLEAASQALQRCRQTLKWTYAFAFYLARNNKTEMFEDNQKDLEMAVENLSEMFEKPVDVIGGMKRDILDKTTYCNNRRLVLLTHTAEELRKDGWEFNLTARLLKGSDIPQFDGATAAHNFANMTGLASTTLSLGMEAMDIESIEPEARRQYRSRLRLRLPIVVLIMLGVLGMPFAIWGIAYAF